LGTDGSECKPLSAKNSEKSEIIEVNDE
jgi:hypothetical protein